MQLELKKIFKNYVRERSKEKEKAGRREGKEGGRGEGKAQNILLEIAFVLKFNIITKVKPSWSLFDKF